MEFSIVSSFRGHMPQARAVSYRSTLNLQEQGSKQARIRATRLSTSPRVLLGAPWDLAAGCEPTLSLETSIPWEFDSCTKPAVFCLPGLRKDFGWDQI